MIKKLQKDVIILGMHRSGTSMVSGLLTNLGVDLGEDALGPLISNPRGHFEDGDFLGLNNAILAAAGGTWDDPPAAPAILETGWKISPPDTTFNCSKS